MGIFGRTILTADPFGAETEDDAAILLQWCEQTLQTRPGTLRTAPEHGFAGADLLLGGLTDAARVSLPALAKAALERGRRVASATATLVTTDLGGGKVGVSLDIVVQPAKGGPSITFTHQVSPAGPLADSMIKGA